MRRDIIQNSAMISVLLAGLLTLQAHAEIPRALEPEYSEAVLAYNAKEHDKALKILNGLAAKNGKIAEFHELQALSLKALNRTEEAAKTYDALIKVRKSEGASDSALAAYHFELGMMQSRLKDKDAAIPNLEFAVKESFNLGPAHFFLGLIHYQATRLGEAEANFEAAAKSGAEDIQAPAHFYLAQIHLKTQFPSGATQNFSLARDDSKEVLANKDSGAETKQVATQILEASTKALTPLDKTGYFGNVGTMGAFDSNVLAQPASTSTSATGLGSYKQSLNWSIGMMTSPLNAYQWIPSYRGTFNLNTNADTRTGQFFTQYGTIYVNRKPLSPKTWGLKLEAAHTMQTQQDTTSGSTGSYAFRPYSFAVGPGGYWKSQVSRSQQLMVELNTAFTNYSADSSGSDGSSSTSNRGGPVITLAGSLKSETSSRFWNPTYGLNVTLNQTSGTEYRNQAFMASIVDSIHWSEGMDFTLGADFTYTNYGSRPDGPRKDNLFGLTLGMNRKLSSRFVLLADVRFASNTSSLASNYSYSRFVAGAGVSYSLF